MSSHPPFFANAQVMALDPAEIFVPDRIGFYHEDKATALGRLIAVDGQRDPIKVQPRKGNQPWKLVTGLHRLRGCEMEGIQVYALEVQGQAEDLADLEASENLHRRPLGPIERAKFTAALVQAAQDRIAREHGDLKQHQLGAKARWQRVKDKETTADQVLQQEADDAADKMSAAYSWQESVADGRVCFLMPNKWLSSQARFNLFAADHPPQAILHLTQRPSMPPGDRIAAMGNRAFRGGMIDYCWVVWDTMRPTKPGQTRTIWLPKLSEPIAPIKGIA